LPQNVNIDQDENVVLELPNFWSRTNHQWCK